MEKKRKKKKDKVKLPLRKSVSKLIIMKTDFHSTWIPFDKKKDRFTRVKDSALESIE